MVRISCRIVLFRIHSEYNRRPAGLILQAERLLYPHQGAGIS